MPRTTEWWRSEESRCTVWWWGTAKWSRRWTDSPTWSLSQGTSTSYRTVPSHRCSSIGSFWSKRACRPRSARRQWTAGRALWGTRSPNNRGRAQSLIWSWSAVRPSWRSTYTQWSYRCSLQRERHRRFMRCCRHSRVGGSPHTYSCGGCCCSRSSRSERGSLGSWRGWRTGQDHSIWDWKSRNL